LDRKAVKQASLTVFVDGLQSRGRYTFTRPEALQSLKSTEVALTFALNRLSKKGRIVAVKRGFYVIVPVEYTASKILPADWFLADLMKFLGQPYYAGLLTAAALHGAAHQQPQRFHVVTTKGQRPIEVKGLGIRFFKKAGTEKTLVQQVKTPTGYISVSTPGATAIDLIAYQNRVGSWDRVATVLQELVEVMDEDGLLAAAQTEKELPSIQRLGWVLAKIGHESLTGKLAAWLHERQPPTTPLDPSQPRKGYPRDLRWNVIVNTEVEGEL
jgi:predicted transcriptional regulator of viral defense system